MKKKTEKNLGDFLRGWGKKFFFILGEGGGSNTGVFLFLSFPRSYSLLSLLFMFRKGKKEERARSARKDEIVLIGKNRTNPTSGWGLGV